MLSVVFFVMQSVMKEFTPYERISIALDKSIVCICDDAVNNAIAILSKKYGFDCVDAIENMNIDYENINYYYKKASEVKTISLLRSSKANIVKKKEIIVASDTSDSE
jgi:hypothetical protein